MFNQISIWITGAIFMVSCQHSTPSDNGSVLVQMNTADLIKQMDQSLTSVILDKWYPLSVDWEDGGFLSTLTRDFKPIGSQDKKIVTQARHVWVNSKASQLYPENAHLMEGARQGVQFMKSKMWDHEYGGFYELVDKKGNAKTDEKTAYGNAFGIYALASFYLASNDSAALNLAKQAFYWLETHSHDPVYRGYFQDLKRNGDPIPRNEHTPSDSPLGYKDQNSSIHLLEAFTELYQAWPDSLLRVRLEEMLILIRDTIITEPGFMVLFFQPDWTPISFRDQSREVITKHHYLDHVSFGHDIEIAYLMLEASHILGFREDQKTLITAKKLVDHALRNGWDESVGGFYDEGYYFKDKSQLEITYETKNWWAQAEGMNTLLLMSRLFPEDSNQYKEKFYQQWNYIQSYLIDPVYGGWFDSGTDKDPDTRNRNKGHIWKGTYHHYRAMENCIRMLRDEHANH